MARLIHIAAFAGLAALSAAGGAVATIGLVAPDLLRARMSPAPVVAPVAPAQASLPAPSPNETSSQREAIAETKVEPAAAPSAEPVPEASPPAPGTIAQESAAQESATQEPAAQEVAAQAASPPDLAVFGALRHPQVEAAPAPRMASLAAPLAILSSPATPLETLALSFARAPIPEDALPPPTGPLALDGPEEPAASEPAAPQTTEHAALVEPRRPPPTGRIVVIDASEGTKLDPLRQKNWDLNAVQVIPALKPEPR